MLGWSLGFLSTFSRLENPYLDLVGSVLGFAYHAATYGVGLSIARLLNLREELLKKGMVPQ